MAASLDEAYLDITEVCKERGITSEEVSWKMNNRITFSSHPFVAHILQYCNNFYYEDNFSFKH